MQSIFGKLNFDASSKRFKGQLNILICYAALLSVAYFSYGIRVFLLALTAALSAFIADAVCTKLQKKKIDFSDLSSVVIAVSFVLLLPASSSYWLVFFGSLAAIVLVRQPFGGTGKCFINPVAAAFCLSAISWSTRIFRYPFPFSPVPALAEVSLESLTLSPAHSMMLSGKPFYSYIELILGNVPGPLGAVNILVICACVLFLYLRKSSNFVICKYTLISAGIFSLIFHRLNTGFIDSLIYELFSGCLLFGAVFLGEMSDEFLPEKSAKILFGITLGLSTMIMRNVGGFEESFCFSLLLCTCIIPLVNKYAPIFSEILNKFVFSKIKEILSKNKNNKTEAAQ
jgi:electron transport complex protein RnfD